MIPRPRIKKPFFCTTVVVVDRYVAAHRNLPQGRGLWHFETKQGRPISSFNGLYKDACHKARRDAIQASLSVIYVCP